MHNQQAQDQQAFDQGFRYVVMHTKVAVYTTTKAEALAEVRSRGGQVFELTDTKRNPEVVAASSGRSSLKEPNWLDVNDLVWTESDNPAFHMTWATNGVLRVFDLQDRYAYNTDSDLEEETARLVFDSWNYASGYVEFDTPDTWGNHRRWTTWREVIYPSKFQVVEFLRRISKFRKLVKIQGVPDYGPEPVGEARQYLIDKWKKYDAQESQIVAKFHDAYNELTLTFPRSTKAQINDDDSIIMLAARIFYPRRRNIRPEIINGRPTFRAVQIPKVYFWNQFVEMAKGVFGLEVSIEGTFKLFSDEVPDEDLNVDVLGGMYGVENASLTYNGKLYVLTGIPNNDEAIHKLGKGETGIKLVRHDPFCSGLIEKEILVAEKRPRKKRGEPRDPLEEKRKKEAKTIYVPCPACENGVPLGAWFTAEAQRAVRVKGVADRKALAAFTAEQERLNRLYQEALTRKAMSEKYLAWSRAKEPTPDMGDPDIPCPPYYIKDGKKIPIGYFDYQKVGILVAGQNKISLIADEMGVGKTVQAIGVINNDPSLQKIVILAPSLSLYNWQKELDRWCIRCNPVSTPNQRQRFKVELMDAREIPSASSNIIILNYEKLVGAHGAPIVDWFMSRQWDLLIVDEAHYCKLRPGLTRETISQRALVLYGWPAEDESPAQDGLVHRANKVIYMTGTPIPNRPIEIWPLLNHMAPGEFGDRVRYGKKFCDLHKAVLKSKVPFRVPDYYRGEKGAEAQWQWGGAGEANREGAFVGDSMPQLQTLLRCYGMVRRLKEDVLNLPEKVRKIVDLPHTPDIERAIEAEQAAILEEEGFSVDNTDENFMMELTREWQDIQQKAKNILDQMASLPPDSPEWKYMERQRVELMQAVRIPFKAISKTRHIMGRAKVGGAMAYIEGLFNQGIQKLVVFAYHNDIMDTMQDRFLQRFGAKYGENCVVRLSGGMTAKQKQIAVDIFQDDPNCKVFLGELMAANSAITLTAAHHVVFVEQDWVPGTMQQAEDRLHRYGATEDVYVHYLVVDGSIDGNMAKILLGKKEMQNRALNITPTALDVEKAFEGLEQGPKILDEDEMVEGAPPEVVVPFPTTVPTPVKREPTFTFGEAVAGDEPVTSTQVVGGVVTEVVETTPKKQMQLKTEFPSIEELTQMLVEQGLSQRGAEGSAQVLNRTLTKRVFTDALQPTNVRCRKVFETVTGFKLPNGLHATQQAILKWARLLAALENQETQTEEAPKPPKIIKPVVVKPPVPVPPTPPKPPVPVQPKPVARPLPPPPPARPVPPPPPKREATGAPPPGVRPAMGQYPVTTHLLLRYLVSRGVNVGALGQGLARLPALTTQGQVEAAIKAIAPYLAMVPAPMLTMWKASKR